ncbi:MAG: phosphate signaling complex protein PhoU [Desulfobacterales bacterium]|nr:phosphate signaling complex protein PhoU [Desulfobacterales bacterium]
MERHFFKELENLKMTILNMAALTQRALENATRAYLERDEQLGQTVIDGDKKINALEIAVDQYTLKLLALEQPMAKDLRMILGTAKISNELERIADQAVNISERTQFLCKYPPLENIPAMDQLIDVSLSMVKKAVSCFVNEDVKTAYEIRKMDDMADEHTLTVLQTLVEYMVKNTPATERRRLNTRRSVQTIIISRCLERTCDLSTNIGEHVAFITEGVNIKHQGIDAEP